MKRLLTWESSDGQTIDLDGSDGVKLLAGAVGLDAPPVALSMQRLVSSDGASLGRKSYPERPVDLPVLIDGQPSVRAQVRSLVAAFQSGRLRSTDGDVVRELRDVHYQGGLNGNEARGRALTDRWRKSTVGLVAMDPWWYGETTTVSLDLSANGQYDEAAPYDEALPWDGTAANPVTVQGDEDADTLVYIEGPFDTLSVSNELGDTVELRSPLASGDVIRIDSTVGNRGPRLNGGSVDWFLLTAASSPWMLPRGTSTMSVASTGSTGASLVEVSLTERWLTP